VGAVVVGTTVGFVAFGQVLAKGFVGATVAGGFSVAERLTSRLKGTALPERTAIMLS